MKTIYVAAPSSSSTANEPAQAALPPAQTIVPRLTVPNEGAAQIAPVAISIVSNSRLLRESLVALMAPYIDLFLVDTYSASPVAPSLLSNPLGHVLLLDGGIGRDAAIAWIRLARGLVPPAQVVVVELPNDINLILACIEAGAGAYSLQDASAGEIARAITAVQRGVAQCSPEVTAQLFARLAARAPVEAVPPTLTTPLTRRELEVLRFISEGRSTQEVATALHIEVRTVKGHVHRILEKLELRNRWDAVRLAEQQGWLNID